MLDLAQRCGEKATLEHGGYEGKTKMCQAEVVGECIRTLEDIYLSLASIV